MMNKITTHMPPDVLAMIKKAGKEVKKISHEDVQGKIEPQQGEVVDGVVGVRKSK